MWHFLTLWTLARQAPLSMGFSRQGYWSGFSFPSPGHLPHAGIEPGSPVLQADSLLSDPPGKLNPGGFPLKARWTKKRKTHVCFNNVWPLFKLGVGKWPKTWSLDYNDILQLDFCCHKMGKWTEVNSPGILNDPFLTSLSSQGEPKLPSCLLLFSCSVLSDSLQSPLL